jgi:hypothetical protein
MNKLTITDKVFVPVSDELPKETGDYIVCVSEIRDVEIVKYYKEVSYDSDKNIWSCGYVKVKVSHWLKEETNKYILSKEEMEKLLNNVSDFGRKYVEKIGKLWNDTEKAYQQHKEEFINSIL